MKGRPEGCVRKRGPRFEAILSVRGEDGRRRRPRRTFKTEPEAKKWLRAQLTALDVGAFVDPSKMTLGEHLTEWLEAIRHGIKLTTFASYKTMLEKHVVPRLGAKRLQAVTVPMLNLLYGELRDAGLSPTSVRYVHVILHRAFSDAVLWERLVKNPATHAEVPVPSRREMRTWTAEEVVAFLNHVSDDRLYAAWYLAVMTGMRRSEVLGLRWSDVDWNGSRLQVQRGLVSVNYSKVVFSDLKNKRGRALDLDARTLAVLREHRKRQMEEAAMLGPDREDQGLVFCRPEGSFIHPDRFGQMFKAHVRGAGVSGIRVHDLRHTWASLALQAGVHLKVVQERLGHSSISVTADTYSHVSQTMQRNAAEQVATLILGAVG